MKLFQLDRVDWRITAVGTILSAAALRVVFGGGSANYDTLYALVWGRSLFRGEVPDYTAELAPTPKPAAIALGAVFAPLGHAAEPAVVALGYLSLAAVAALAFVLAQRVSGKFGGLLAALLVLTREPVLSFGLRAYADLAYVALLLTALAVETHRRRAGIPVLLLLGFAGLIRPEAWLFSMLYALWLWPRRRSARAFALILAVMPMLLWVGSDLMATGDPLWSLVGTQEGTRSLGRPTGLVDAVLLAPRRLGEIVREPVLIASIGGAFFGALTAPRTVLPLLGAIAVALVSFGVMAAAGLPVLGRYLLLPASLLVVLTPVGMLGWRRLPPAHRLVRPWKVLAAFVVVLLLATSPAQARRLTALARTLHGQRAIAADLHALGDAGLLQNTCGPVRIPNHRPAPALALWLDLPPALIAAGPPPRGATGTFVVPSNPRVVRLYALDPLDPSQGANTAPDVADLVGVNRSWRIYERCLTGASGDGGRSQPASQGEDARRG